MSASSITAVAQQWQRVNAPLIVGLVVLAFIIWPVYLLPPGYPQPLSLVLLLSFLCLLARDGVSAAGIFRGAEMALLLAFVIYALVVNLLVAIANQDVEPLRHPLYYLQVLLGCAVFQFVLRTEPLAPRILYAAVQTALLLQFTVLAFSAATEGIRHTLLYANPNQLGFFGLLAMSFLLLFHLRGAGSAALSVAGAVFALSLIMLSLSKAALISAFVLLVLYGLLAPIQGRRLRRLRPLLIAVMPALLAGLAIVYHDQVQILTAVADRLAQIGESGDDSLAGRSYVRILMWPQYLIFGAGEGVLDRWEHPREIHSMMGTLIFSYGLPGTLLVLSLLAVVCRRNWRDFIIFMIPVLLYSLTHHPMRQTMMWALLLLIAHQPPARMKPGIR